MGFLQDKSFFQEKILQKKLKLMQAQEANKRLAELKIQLNQLLEVKEETNNYYNKLNQLKRVIIKEDDSYKERRLSYVNGVVTDALAQIFPEESVTAIINCDFVRKDSVSLELHSDNEMILDPEMNEGKLMQYLISFSAVSAITKALGSNTLYVDEAFGVSEPERLPKIGKILGEKAKNTQIILVSQNAGLYEDEPYRLFHLEKDSVTEITSLVEVTDVN